MNSLALTAESETDALLAELAECATDGAQPLPSHCSHTALTLLSHCSHPTLTLLSHYSHITLTGEMRVRYRDWLGGREFLPGIYRTMLALCDGIVYYDDRGIRPTFSKASSDVLQSGEEGLSAITADEAQWIVDLFLAHTREDRMQVYAGCKSGSCVISLSCRMFGCCIISLSCYHITQLLSHHSAAVSYHSAAVCSAAVSCAAVSYHSAAITSLSCCVISLSCRMFGRCVISLSCCIISLSCCMLAAA